MQLHGAAAPVLQLLDCDVAVGATLRPRRARLDSHCAVIADGAFQFWHDTELHIPVGVVWIGAQAFMYAKGTFHFYPAFDRCPRLRFIGTAAFQWATILATVTNEKTTMDGNAPYIYMYVLCAMCYFYVYVYVPCTTSHDHDDTDNVYMYRAIVASSLIELCLDVCIMM